MSVSSPATLLRHATAMTLMGLAVNAIGADERGIILPPSPVTVHALVATLEGDYSGLPEQDDPRFGYSVALYDDTLAVGAPGTLTGSGDTIFERGAVFLYRRHPDNQSWQFLQRIAFGTGGDGQCGYSVALSEYSLLIGCPFHQVGGQPRGRAVFYRRNPAGMYVDPQIFADASVQTGARCGTSVTLIDAALGTDSPLPMAAVGCPDRRDFPQGDSGLVGGVDIYHNLLGVWGESTSLPGLGTSNTGFGQSLSLNRTGPEPGMTLLLAVGTPGTTSTATGSARIYAMGATVGDWTLEHQIAGPANGSRFGHSIHMRLGRLAVGAPQRPVLNPTLNPPIPVPSGSLTITTRSCTIMGQCGWSQNPDEILAIPTFPSPAAQNRFGHTVHALTPNRIIAGAPLYPMPAFLGQARHYELDSGDWVLNEDEPFYPAGPVLPTSEFAAAVSGDEAWLAIGAPGYPQEHTGRVYVYAYDYDDTIFADGFECGGGPGCR